MFELKFNFGILKFSYADNEIIDEDEFEEKSVWGPIGRFLRGAEVKKSNFLGKFREIESFLVLKSTQQTLF